MLDYEKFRVLLRFLHAQADDLKRNNPNNFYQHPTFVVDFFAQRSAVVINLYEGSIVHMKIAHCTVSLVAQWKLFA